MENKQLRLEISKHICSLYEFHDYTISDANIVKLAGLICEIDKHITPAKFANFVNRVEMGEFGTLYKMPTCLTSMFQQFVNSVGMEFRYNAPPTR